MTTVCTVYMFATTTATAYDAFTLHLSVGVIMEPACQNYTLSVTTIDFSALCALNHNVFYTYTLSTFVC